MDCPPDGGGPTPGVASKRDGADICAETPMTIEELLAKALYSERERKLEERRLMLEAERARRRAPQRQTAVISRAPRPDRDRAIRQRRAA